MFFAPSIVRRETLLEQTGIDSRSPDTLVIEVRVSTAHYKGTPVISSLQYRSNEEARRDCAVSFIKKDTGLALVCPTIPHYLVLRGAQFVAAVAQLSPDQREWHNQLEEQARLRFDVVRDSSLSDGARKDACEWVWNHLGRGTGVDTPNPALAPLWVSSSSHAASWDVLLQHWGTSILADKRPSPDTSNGAHSYILRLQGANPLLTHVLACVFSSYALLRGEVSEITKQWQSLLSPASTNESSSTSTDSSDSSSGDDDGWQKARTDKRRLNQSQRHAKLLPQRVVAFQQKHITGKVAVRFNADTRLPLLALSTTVRIRAWEERYTICLVDNFASLGCDTRDLASDPIFLKLSTSTPGLTPPHAKWVVNPRNGGDVASIYVRDQDKDNAMPAALNAKVKALLPGTSGELKVDWRLWRTNARGRVLYSLGTRKVCLNETVPTVQPIPSHSKPVLPAKARGPAEGATSSSTARQPPPAGSWAAAVQLGVKRLSVTNTLNHRPKKKSQDTTPQPGPSGSLPKPPKPQTQSAGRPNTSGQPTDTTRSQATMPQQVQARLDAMEQLIAKLQADHATTFDKLAQTMDSFTAGIAEQQRIIFEQQRSTTDALGAITQQLTMLSQRMFATQPYSPPSSQAQMLSVPFAPMSPLSYQGYNVMTSPMISLQQHAGVLAAGASASAAAYSTMDSHAAYMASQPHSPLHQLTPQGLPQWSTSPPMTYPLSLTSESSASAAPAHNGEVAHNG
jgi:hypothetical protein